MSAVDDTTPSEATVYVMDIRLDNRGVTRKVL
jgi:hypothetical protein